MHLGHCTGMLPDLSPACMHCAKTCLHASGDAEMLCGKKVAQARCWSFHQQICIVQTQSYVRQVIHKHCAVEQLHRRAAETFHQQVCIARTLFHLRQVTQNTVWLHRHAARRAVCKDSVTTKPCHEPNYNALHNRMDAARHVISACICMRHAGPISIVALHETASLGGMVILS